MIIDTHLDLLKNGVAQWEEIGMVLSFRTVIIIQNQVNPIPFMKQLDENTLEFIDRIKDEIKNLSGHLCLHNIDSDILMPEPVRHINIEGKFTV